MHRHDQTSNHDHDHHDGSRGRVSGAVPPQAYACTGGSCEVTPRGISRRALIQGAALGTAALV
ncbi:MAG: hypothetical protein ACTHQE_15550, partial [Thermomicrobiales bacterium]